MRDYSNELNQKQFEAVTSKKQFLRIIAGAGSGKTRVLTYRIAYLIENENIDPSEILAITFTNKVANEMKERASSLVNVPTSKLLIKTFHSFCAYFLRKEAPYCLDFPRNFIIYDEVDQKEKIKAAAIKAGIEKKDKLVGEAYNYICYQKGKGVYPDQVKTGDFRFKEEKKLLEVYYLYEQLKYDDRAFDFDDLILKTISILKNFPQTKMKWQSYFTHILIDEFQDTNDQEYLLLRLLMSPVTSLYVVGDPDQTIYTWRGANQSIILDLNQNFPGLETIILDKNYRSTKTILNHSNKLISHNQYRVEKALNTDNEDGEIIKIYNGWTRGEEADWIIKQIQSLRANDSNFSFNDVAILFRNSYISGAIESKLAMSRMPYVIYGGIRFYQRKEIKIVIAYFRLLLNLKEDFSFYKIINEPKRKVGEASVLQLQYEASNAGLSAYEYIKNIEKYDDSKLKFSVLSALSVMISKIEEAQVRYAKKDEALIAILEDLINDIGIYEYLIELEDGEDRITNVKSLLDQMNSFFKENPDLSLEDFLENVALASAQDEIKDGEKIKLMTVHTAKGLEFKNVFVMGVNQNVFPSMRTIEESGLQGLEEERRLCYVAFTRAKKRLFVSCNKEYSYVTGSKLEESVFFKEAGLSFRSESLYRKDPLSKYENLFNQSTKVDRPRPQRPTVNKYAVGAKLKHVKFGVGTIVDIVDDILVIDFRDHGIKKITRHFPGLTPYVDEEAEL